MPRSPGQLLQPLSAVVASALYLVVALLSLLLPALTSSDLAGVWSILLTLPWSAFFPLGFVNAAAPGLASASRLLLTLVAMAVNAILLYLGMRWARRWSTARRP